MLRVCGFSRGQVTGLIFGEAALIAAAGLLVGFGLGYAALFALGHAAEFQGYVQAVIRPGLVAGIAATALVTAVAGAIYPAWFAARIQPADALRYE